MCVCVPKAALDSFFFPWFPLRIPKISWLAAFRDATREGPIGSKHCWAWRMQKVDGGLQDDLGKAWQRVRQECREASRLFNFFPW